MTEQAPSCDRPSWYDSDPDQRALTPILKGLKQDLSMMGCVALGNDGVLRSLDADRNVVDAVGLSPKLVEAFQRRAKREDYTEGECEGLDGTKITEEVRYHPDKAILPPPLTEQTKEDIRLSELKNPGPFEEKRREFRGAWEKKAKHNCRLCS
ncbi:hypothetical protein SCUP234_11247 [Seiridium cupressi]